MRINDNRQGHGYSYGRNPSLILGEGNWRLGYLDLLNAIEFPSIKYHSKTTLFEYIPIRCGESRTPSRILKVHSDYTLVSGHTLLYISWYGSIIRSCRLVNNISDAATNQNFYLMRKQILWIFETIRWYCHPNNVIYQVVHILSLDGLCFTRSGLTL